MPTKKKPATKKPVKVATKRRKKYVVVIETDNIALARACAVIAKIAHDAEPEVTTFDAPLPGCGGPGDPC